ncbi:MAG: outer membrane protein [Paracoccaceae bacterium]
MKRTVLLAFGVLATPLAAFAGGPIVPPEEPVVVAPIPVETRPDGDWTGFYGGGQLGYGRVFSGGAGLDGEDVLGGIHVGYRWDLGQAVLGTELDYNIADISLGVGDTSLDSVARLKLLAGADLGRTLVYASAGAAQADATLAGASASDDGYFVGVGVDYSLTENWTVGGELLEHRFDNFDGTGVDLKATTLQAKVAFRF